MPAKISKNIFPSIMLILILIFTSCEVKFGVNTDSVLPYISRVDIPLKIYLNAQAPQLITVYANDPQGRSDIKSIEYEVFTSNEDKSIGKGTCYDTGDNGDIVHGDGKYTAVLDPGIFSGVPGEYYIYFTAFDKEENKCPVFSDTLNVVNEVQNLAPQIVSVTVQDTVSAEQADSLLVRVKVWDPQGTADVCSVYCALYIPQTTEPEKVFTLQKEALPNDSVFTGVIDLKSNSAGPGIYSLRFTAKDSCGLESWPLVKSIYFNTENHAPVLSELIAPDSLSRSDSTPFTLKITVNDEEGLRDVTKVWFTVKRPDGTEIDNIFDMYDNGESGDETAGDGIFSLAVTISSQNDTGVYEFTFKAKDRSGLESEPLVHNITVVE
ncbi:hypothetical protein DRQ07_00810 [candidate division KSB1 bacterium]|nr:MAG: hypothetical protein DRQ07_00810 [candidate division KSB1 bacterium]